VAWLLDLVPGGPARLVEVAVEHHKFSLGSASLDPALPSIWVVFLYGLVTNLQNFGIDQSYVQRYITARSDRDAAKSVWMGGLFYIPISALFLFIGTALFALYQTRPGLLPAGTKADAVFPFFISTELPAGIKGLLLAAICGAAMDSNLNCCATLVLCDIYKRYFRPRASERESMRVLHLTTLFFGAASTIAALAMIAVKTALDTWWQLAGIFSGGMLGLFLLGMISRRAGNRAAAAGVIGGVLVILWMTFSPAWTGALEPFRSPFHGFMTIVVGTVAILAIGSLVSCLGGKRQDQSSE
jgi:solute:Na+ symporter, SSS family